MTLLLLGLALFIIAHLGTTVAMPIRARMVAAIGEVPWKAVIALTLIGSIWLIVRGYGKSPTDAFWASPDWMRYAVVASMLPTLILYMGSYPGSALRARLRHPQLIGFSLWALLHLIANGEVRAIVLFGGLLVWGLVQIVLLNRRDGDAPLPLAHSSTARAWASVPIGIAVWVGLLLAHQWLFGVNPLA